MSLMSKNLLSGHGCRLAGRRSRTAIGAQHDAFVAARRYLVYNGGTPKYVNTINKVAASGYEGVVLSADRGPAPAAGQPAAVA